LHYLRTNYIIVHKDTTLYKIVEFDTEWFNVWHTVTSTFRVISIFKSFFKQNNDSSKTCRYIYNLLLYKTTLQANAGITHFKLGHNRFQILSNS